MKDNESEVSDTGTGEISVFLLNDLLIDGRYDTFPGTTDMQLMYSESERITYVTDNNSIAAIILTDDTYSLHAGLKVGDTLTQALIDQYHCGNLYGVSCLRNYLKK